MVKSIGDFVSNNIGWTFNLVTAHILFWAVAFPIVLEYGYDNNSYDSKGGIPSGGEGSGVFIICVTLVILASLVYGVQLKSYFSTTNEKEE